MKVIDRLINRNLQVSKYLSFFKKSEERKNGPLITISREKGAGGRIVAAELAKKLGGKWDYYHRDILEKIAQETNVSLEDVKKVDEKDIPYLEGVFGSWIGQEYLSFSRYTKTLLKVLADLGNRGYVIIVGHGANFLFKDALKVQIIADFEQRIAWLKKYEKLSEKDAKTLIKKSDKERHDFIYNLFGQDVYDPKHYDVIIKTSEDLTAKDVADIIARIAKKKLHLI